MDLRVLVLTADHDLGELVRAQVENLGCRCSMAETYDAASSSLSWAEAAIVDLAGDGLDDLNRLLVEAPMLRVLAIAPGDAQAAGARSAGIERILMEPFSIADIIDAVRSMSTTASAEVVDLRGGAAPSAADTPWFSTR
jgi:DNA-binding response OmpR family regulator